MSFRNANLGHGIGLRPRHYQQFLEERPPVDWIEVVTENFMAPGGRPRAVLEKVRDAVPIALHGVSLSIGAVAPLCPRYLTDLKALIHRVDPVCVSDHLSWGRFGDRYVHDLLPLPYTEEAITHVAERVRVVQDVLGRQLLLENVSSYVAYRDSELSEWEFLAEVASRADCGILLDVNNVYVSAHNHGFDPHQYIASLPPERVAQIHLAGHNRHGHLLIDTHDQPVPEAVWNLYRYSAALLGRVPTLIEWDDNVPELEVLVAESRRAAEAQTEALAAPFEVRP